MFGLSFWRTGKVIKMNFKPVQASSQRCLSLLSNSISASRQGYSLRQSQICDYYEQTYQMTGPIWLITHFYTPLLNRILKYTHHQAIFDCLFTVVRVSIDEQEWIDSLDLLRKLCQSCIVNGITSDDHVEYLYKMVKEIRDNISKDKNGTVFAFLDGISSS